MHAACFAYGFDFHDVQDSDTHILYLEEYFSLSLFPHGSYLHCPVENCQVKVYAGGDN